LDCALKIIEQDIAKLQGLARQLKGEACLAGQPPNKALNTDARTRAAGFKRTLMSKKLVVIGNGMAGVAAIEAILKTGADVSF